MSGIGDPNPEAVVEIHGGDGSEPVVRYPRLPPRVHSGRIAKALRKINRRRAKSLGYDVAGFKKIAASRILSLSKGDEAWAQSEQHFVNKELNIKVFNEEILPKLRAKDPSIPTGNLQISDLIDVKNKFNEILGSQQSSSERASAAKKFFDDQNNRLAKLFLQQSMLNQYGRGISSLRDNFGWLDSFSGSWDNFFNGLGLNNPFKTGFGASGQFIYEVIALIDATVQHDGCSIEISSKNPKEYDYRVHDLNTGAPLTLVECRCGKNDSEGKMLFSLGKNVPGDQIERGLEYIASSLASRRQVARWGKGDRNVATLLPDDDVARGLKLGCLLLQHHFHVDISKLTGDSYTMTAINNAAPGSDIKKLWDILQTYHATFAQHAVKLADTSLSDTAKTQFYVKMNRELQDSNTIQITAPSSSTPSSSASSGPASPSPLSLDPIPSSSRPGPAA